MKIFTFLFSIYLLTLACLPCADREECNEPSKKVFAAANHNEHSHDTESCTPFCICNCCGIQVVQAASVFYITQAPLFMNQQKVGAYYQPISTRACHNIWQPPRLG